MAILPVGFAVEAGGYQIERSLRFNSADSAYLNRTPSGAGTSATIWTFSWWQKGVALTGSTQVVFGAESGGARDMIRWDGNGTLEFFKATSAIRVLTPKYRDPSAWYHFVINVSGTTVGVYVNGVQVTAFATSNNPSGSWYIGQNNLHRIGLDPTGGDALNGYLAEVHFIDGQALTPSSFGETDSDTGVWKPKAYSGSYGTNGFYLDFGDNSSTTALGYDAAGSNDWTPNNFSVTAGAGNDSLVDSPTRYGTDTGVGGEVRGNYATWNPLVNGDSSTNGNLDVTNDTARSTQELLNFDVYWEITSSGGTTTAGTVSDTGTTNTTTIANGKTYGFQLSTSGSLQYKNITDSGAWTSITTGLSAKQFIYASTGAGVTASLNAGQRVFSSAAPSGFKALCTTNLPTPTVAEGKDYFNAVLYTGTGSSRTVTGVGFQPDWLWIKSRSNAYNNNVWDAVRGAGQRLITNATDAEETQTGDMSAFASDGFTVGSGSITNGNGATFVAWNWKASGAGSSNTAGTISSTVSANTTAGFSIVTYTGTGSNATVGHGLGVAPAMMIFKNRGSVSNWRTYHSALGPTKALTLDGTGAASTFNFWQDTAPTSTVFYLSSHGDANESGKNIVGYCFAPIAGYSAFGSYTGNGSSDGPYVHLGFRPRLIIWKGSSFSSNWRIADSARNTYNVALANLQANLADAEGATSNTVDFLSNGFKVRGTGGDLNTSSGTIIYMAFAENPFKFSLAR
jgi:hypothetical protein